MPDKPQLQLTWQDRVTGHTGGGLRMRAGWTLDEVRGARTRVRCSRRYLEAVRTYVETALAGLGVESSFVAVHPLLDDPAEARRRVSDAFAITVDGVPLGVLVLPDVVVDSASASNACSRTA
ncbi:hypothetical protein [Amycolatopsis sp. cmx-11-51]|uniref:hypothetical protein n=1 Tax=unclassified Amycolatopsis TaxID=2618356 RepID=UPI0039E3CBA3